MCVRESYVCMHVYEWAHMCVSVQDQWSASDIFLNCSPPFFMRSQSLTEPGVTNLSRLTVQQDPGIVLSLQTQPSYCPWATTTVLTWFLGTELRYWSWYGKHFADWTISTLQDLNLLPECFTSISWMKTMTQKLDNSETKSIHHSYRRIKFGFSTHL